ncbi:MAG: hypothetical protein H6736_19265 [Alphaproteobacteria bacterium]|nr:hypothetical protein [Alphaproteobacteria bacterium]
MKEEVTLEARKGGSGPATADIDRFSGGQRLMKALPIALGGLLLGAGSIVIPGVHLISTWAIPLLGFGIAWYYYSRVGAVGSVEGSCPACGEGMVAEGGPWEDPMWVRCPKCNEPLQVKLSTPMGG